MDMKNLKEMIDIEDLKAELLKHLNSGENNNFKYEYLSEANNSENTAVLLLKELQNISFDEQTFELFICKNNKIIEQIDLIESDVRKKILNFHYPSFITKSIGQVRCMTNTEDKYKPEYLDAYLFSITFTLKLPSNITRIK